MSDAQQPDWARLDALLDGALEVASPDRRRWLEAECAGEPALLARALELLRFAEEDEGGLRPGGALDVDLGSDVTTAAHVAPRVPSGAPGQRLGRYELRGLLGAGGMGRVYRAFDPRLGREVAIKALADDIRDDPTSLRRFEREARALANLNHANVATIYGLELLDGQPYLVLELVEGETLLQRLARGPLALPEALEVARQVAEGLEEAHRKGVIHRDLKPSNVMLTPGGRVKLVDFGVAKAVRPDGDDLRLAHTRTAPGAVLGTAPYMSPEQVRGEEVDARTDVWAFGCLFYEVLSGRRAFPGGSSPEVLAAVLRDEVDLSALPAETPQAVRRLLARCLRKDRHRRLQDVGDARLELEELDLEAVPAAGGRRTAARILRSATPWAVAAMAVAAAFWAIRSPRAAPAPPTVRLSLDFPAGFELADDWAAPFAISPDGRRLAVIGRRAAGEPRRLFLREVGALELVELAATDGAWMPFFSADGGAVAFFADRKLKKAALHGGPVVTLADVGGNPRGASWAPDGSIVLAMSQTSGLIRVAEGEEPEPLTTLAPSEESHRWPQVLPGGGWVLFTVEEEEEEPYDLARLDVVSLATGERRRVLTGGAFGRYVASGHLVFVRSGRLFAVPFDRERMETRGAPQPVLEGVRYDPRNGASHLAVSESGTLVYGPGVATSLDRYVVWAGADGRLTRLVDTPRIFREPRLSPDGQRVAMGVGPAGSAELWFLDIAGSTLSPGGLARRPHRPAWRPDGSAVTVGVEEQEEKRWRLITVSADGSGGATPLLERPHAVYPGAWSPDGRFLVYQERRPETGWDLFVLEADPSGRLVGTPRPLSATRAHEANPSLSADGRWVAYESDELDGIVELYVRAFPGGEGKVRASTTGARWPRWGPGLDLYYWTSFVGGLQRVEARVGGGRFAVLGSAPVWAPGDGPGPERRLVVKPGYESYDVHPAGGRFLMLETSEQELEPALRRPVVVLDWAGELGARFAGEAG